MREPQPGDKRLVAYLAMAAGAPCEPSRLREALGRTLPDHMVPAQLVFLDVLPLNANGKVDRGALPAPLPERPELASGYEPPQSEDEEVLAAIWAEVLGLERVGVLDDFFALGGDSILSLRVVALARQRGLDLSLERLFAHGTIRGLAAGAEAAAEEPAAAPGPAPFALLGPGERERLPADVEDAYPLTAMQRGMLFHLRLAPQNPPPRFTSCG